MTNIPLRRSQQLVTQPPSRKPFWVVLVVSILFVGAIAGYFLTQAQTAADEQRAVDDVRLREVDEAYQRLIERLANEASYQTYALQSAKDMVATNKIPNSTDIAFASPHRNPAAIDVIVNKQNPIYPLLYAAEVSDVSCSLEAPQPVATAAINDLTKLCEAAMSAGVPLQLTSGYRSYLDQTATYRWWIAYTSEEIAPSQAALPGYSEHQTGLAVDFKTTSGAALQAFCTTPTAAWLAAHSDEYGFIQHFTPDNETVTGYSAECWHYRYIGRDAARAYVEQEASSLEQFWDVWGGSYETRTR